MRCGPSPTVFTTVPIVPAPPAPNARPRLIGARVAEIDDRGCDGGAECRIPPAPRVELAVRIGMCRTGPRRCRRDKTANRGLTWRKQPGGTMIERGWLMQRGIEPRIPLLGAPPPSCFRSPLSSVTAVFLLGWQNEKDRPLPASGERERPAKREGEGRRRCRSDRPVPQLGTNPPSTLYACPVMLRAPGEARNTAIAAMSSG
jgi:hypothetical protein